MRLILRTIARYGGVGSWIRGGNLALRLTGNREEALDASQEAFLRAFRHLMAYAGRSSFKTWLYAIVINACRDHGRRAGRLPALIGLDVTAAGPESDDRTSTGDSPEEALLRRELHRELAGAITRLADPYRTVIVLMYVNDLSVKEISKVLAIPVTVVKNRLFRARRQLHALLAKYLNEEGAKRDA